MLIYLLYQRTWEAVIDDRERGANVIVLQFFKISLQQGNCLTLCYDFQIRVKFKILSHVSVYLKSMNNFPLMTLSVV